MAVYRGNITLREAFARSSNAATVRLSESVGRGNVLRAARELGISSPLPDAPSVALGTAGVSLLEMTAAYAAVAGGRYPVEPRGLELSQADDGFARFLRRGGSLDGRRDLAPMLDLYGKRPPKALATRRAGRADLGKTCTTQGNRDAFSSVSPVIWWSGDGRRDDNKSLGKMTGGWRRQASGAISWCRQWPSTGRRATTAAQLPRAQAAPRAQRPHSHVPRHPRARRTEPLPEDWSKAPASCATGQATRRLVDNGEGR